MNPDSHEDWLDHVSGRRPDPETIRRLQSPGVLSAAERRRLADELALNGLLDGHRPAPGPASNFTARVIDRVSREGSTIRPAFAWWPCPRVLRILVGATAAAVACMVAVAIHRGPSNAMAPGDVAIALDHAASIPGMEPSTLADFEAVRRLGSRATEADDALILALSE